MVYHPPVPFIALGIESKYDTIFKLHNWMSLLLLLINNLRASAIQQYIFSPSIGFWVCLFYTILDIFLLIFSSYLISFILFFFMKNDIFDLCCLCFFRVFFKPISTILINNLTYQQMLFSPSNHLILGIFLFETSFFV